MKLRAIDVYSQMCHWFKASSVEKTERDCVQGARLTSVLSHKIAYVGRFWKFSMQRQTNHVGSSQGPKDKAA